ncbi:Remodeling and spacing factor 1 [Halotydeus destructor]|nr:Remodeling and spacing factor 1 [Halotydeus destructor]
MATSEVEPASPMDKDRPASQNDTVLNCESQPDFAVICSFFFKFGSALGLTYGIDELKEWLEDTRQISDELIDLHIKLLRKWKKYINKDKWEMTLVKYMLQYSNVDAWELELRGYSSIKLSIKIEVLKRLLETQFDHNTKFKTEVNALDSSSLRLLPIGRDVSGNQYWYQLDSDANIRVYREETDDEKSWSLVSKNKEDLSQLITHLETHNTLQPVKEESSANASESDSESEHESTKSPEPKSEHVDPVQLELNSKIMSLVSVKVEPTEPSNDEHNRELLNLVKSEISKSNIKPCIVEATISDEQTVVNVVQQLLSRVCTQDCHETSNYSELYDKSIGTHDIASDVCSYLVNSICTLHEPEPLSSSKNDICNSIFHETPKAAEKTIVLPDATTTAIKSDDAITKPPETPEEDITKASPTTRGRGRGRGRSRGRGRGAYLSRELRELNGMKSDDEVPEEIDVPQKRQSRRIQVLQEKKSAELANKMKKEQERLEELAHKRAESTKQREEQKKRFTEQNGSTERRYKTDSDEESPEEEEEDDSDDDHSRSRSTGKRKGKKRRRRGTKGKKGGNTRPWDSSDGEDESAHESEEPEEEEEEMLKFDDNDDEFACEEIEPDSEPVILKRARTAKKAKRDSDEESGAEEEPEDDALCKRCGKGDHPEWILLCDKCDIGFHTACCLPPLMMIPDGDWFCPPCENVMLVEKLYEEMSLLEKLLEQREKEELRQQQLKILSVELEKVVETADEKVEPKLNGVSHEKRRKERKVADESNPGSSEEEEEATNSDRSDDSEFLALRSTRNRKINYRFKEYDDLINSAIRNDDYVEDIQNNAEAEPEMEETDNALKKVAVAEGENGVPAVVVESKDSDEAADKEDENSEDDYKEPVKGKKGRQKGSKKGAKKRRLNDLDSPSEDDDSDESFKGSSATEVEEGSDDDGSATEVSEEDDSDDSDVREYKRRPARSKSSGRGKKATRGKPVTKKVKKRGYRRDEFVTDSDEDDSGDGGRTRSRKAAVKRKSYKEETSDDETEEEWDEKPTKKKKGKGSGSSDEEWGGKRETSGKKSKKESDDDDEGTEDDDDDDEKDEQATEGEDDDDISNDSENAPPSPPKKKSKLEPKEKEPPKKKITKEAEMRGKPRLSKARMISMKEAAEDSDETEEELPKKKKLTTTIEAVEDTDDDETFHSH